MPPDQRDAKAERAREIRYGSNLSQLPVHGSSSLVGVDDRSMLGSRRSSNQVYHDSTRESAPSGLIVEDTLGELAPGQTRVGAFLAALRSSLTETAEQVLAETTWSTDKCPSIAEWFGYYETKEATHIEAAILKFVPEAARATTAEEYIPLISERVRQSVATWVRTGDVVGIPGHKELPLNEARTREGVTLQPDSVSPKEFDQQLTPSNLNESLGRGQPLDRRVKAPMEAAYGVDFSGVRVHSDAGAETLASRLDAHAFAIGEHIGFENGAYRPGTLLGDALIAHELAHVAQQQNATAEKSLTQASPSRAAVEVDANRSALAAISSMWSGLKGLASTVAEQAAPRLQSGLSLQRCTSKFPSYSQIVSDSSVQSATDAAWASTEAAANATGRREEGFWIQLDTANQNYQFTGHFTGPTVGPTVGASATPGVKPADIPNAAGPTYTVGLFHTHTPTAFRPVGRGVGPSNADENFHNGNDVVGVVYDYEASPAGSGNIPAGHPIGSPAKRYHSGPNRRQNE